MMVLLAQGLGMFAAILTVFSLLAGFCDYLEYREEKHGKGFK